jgi:hypothetical protein
VTAIWSVGDYDLPCTDEAPLGRLRPHRASTPSEQALAGPGGGVARGTECRTPECRAMYRDAGPAYTVLGRWSHRRLARITGRTKVSCGTCLCAILNGDDAGMWRRTRGPSRFTRGWCCALRTGGGPNAPIPRCKGRAMTRGSGRALDHGVASARRDGACWAARARVGARSSRPRLDRMATGLGSTHADSADPLASLLGSSADQC